MSEQAPRSNSRLDNFEANKAAYDQEQFETALYGDAGQIDSAGNGHFTEEDRARLDEGFAYERYMEALSMRPHDDRFLADLNGQPSPAFEQEHQDALDENEVRSARAIAERQAFNDKLAGDPQVRRMLMMADEIAALGARTFDETNADSLVQSLKDKEDKLNDLLVKYSERDDADPAVADYIIDRTAQPTASSSAGEASLAAPGAKATKSSDIDFSWVEDEPADSSSTSSNDPVPAEEGQPEAVDPKNPAIDFSWLDEDSNDTTDGASSEPPAAGLPRHSEIDTSWADEDDDLPQTDDGGSPVIASKRPEIDFSWLDEDDEAQPKRRFSWLRSPFLRLGMLYQNGLNKLAERKDNDDSHERRGSRGLVVAAVGAIAVVGALTAWKLGAFDHLFSGNKQLPPSGGGGSGAAAGTPSVGPGVETGGTGSSSIEFSSAAYSVHHGEGWYETFNDMNIPKSEWSSLLQKAGPKLQENGWAYQMPDGSWGISHPGTLPQGMLELIQKNR